MTFRTEMVSRLKMMFRVRPEFANGGNDFVERPLPSWEMQLDLQEGKVLLPGNFDELRGDMLLAFAERIAAPLAAPFKWIASTFHGLCIG